MKLTILTLGLASVLLAGGCSQLGTDAGKSSLSDEGAPSSGLGLAGDEEVPLDELPQVVTAAALAAVPGLALSAAEAEIEDGVLVYALSGTDGGEAVEIDVTLDGQVLKVERGGDEVDEDDEDEEEHEQEGEHEDGDDEEQIPIDQVPAVVMNAALAAVPGLVVDVAEKELEDGVTVYCLQGTAAGEAVEVDVTAEGKVLEVEQGEEEEAGGEEEGDEDED